MVNRSFQLYIYGYCYRYDENVIVRQPDPHRVISTISKDKHTKVNNVYCDIALLNWS